jgi:hypothetical protein
VEEGSGAVRPRLSFESRLRLVRVRHLVVHVVECMGALAGGPGSSVSVSP